MAGTRNRDNHEWGAATYVPLTSKAAKHGLRRGTVRVPAEVKIDVLEVICLNCRRAYHDVCDQQCTASLDRDHLIGGPTGERRKRDADDLAL